MPSEPLTHPPKLTALYDGDRRRRRRWLGTTIILIPFLIQLALIATRFFDLTEHYIWWEFLQPLAILLPFSASSLLALMVCKAAIQQWPSKPGYLVSGPIGLAWSLLTGITVYLSMHFMDRYIYRTIVEPQRNAQGFPIEAWWDLPQTPPKFEPEVLLVLCGLLALVMIPCFVIGHSTLRRSYRDSEEPGLPLK